MAAHKLMNINVFFIFMLLNVYASASKVPAIIVFGDSSVDAGNNNHITTIARSNFEPYGKDFPGKQATGRFCNGRIATDFISEAFGIKPSIPAYLDPAYGIKDFATGVSFGSAATGWDNATSDVLNVLNVWKQLEYFKDYKIKLAEYLGPAKANSVVSEALYVISIGTNDFLENYYLLSSRRRQYTVDKYEDYLVDIAGKFMSDVYAQGARKMTVTSLPPIGCFPLERTENVMGQNQCREEHNKVASDYNNKLEAKVGEMRTTHAGFDVVFTDIYHKWLEMMRDPKVYGFENVAEGCCATGMFEMGYLCNRFNPFTCTDADKYVFWDSFHPTQKTYKFIAQQSMKTTLAKFL